MTRGGILLVSIGFAISVAAASGAAADPRDSVDRGQRLDTDALRDDVSTNRLKQPTHPLQIAPTQATPTQAAPKPKAERKKKTSTSSVTNR